MDRIEAGNTLRFARQEIQQLRKQNELLAAQVFVIQVFARALGLSGNSGAGLDVVPSLEKLEDELDKKLRSEEQ